MAIRCYKYWAEPASVEDAERLHQVLRLANDYRRVLIDIENRSRALQRALWAWPMRAIPIEERKAWREEQGGNAELKAWTKSDEYRAFLAQIRAATAAAGRWARGEASARGLHYGTYWLVEEAVATAARTTRWENDLSFRPQARVGAPIDANNKPTPRGILGEAHTRLRLGTDVYALGPRVDGYRSPAPRGTCNRAGKPKPRRLRELAIRVGSEGRAPVWARLHVLTEPTSTNRTRPLPDGRIAQAWVQRRIIAGEARWEAVFAMELADVAPPTHPHPGRVVGVDLGWRRCDDGMRVAYAVGTDSHEAAFVIPPEVEGRKAKSDDLRSIRDLRRNAYAHELATWVAAHPGTWLDGALVHLQQWRRVGHFVRLEQAWRAQRVEGDEEVYQALRAFLKQDRHLHAREAHNLIRMRNQILGRAQAWARALCKRYRVLVIEKLDLTQLKEVDDPGRVNARAIQRLAPGEVRYALRQAASKLGVSIVEIPAKHTTRRCAECGHLRELADPAALVLTCDACGYAEDQDRTAARNLIRASAEATQADGQALAAAKARRSKPVQGPRRTRRAVVDPIARE